MKNIKYLYFIVLPLLLIACAQEEISSENSTSQAGELAGETSNMAGTSAGELIDEMAGETAGETSGETAGETAGTLAGESAGMDQAGMDSCHELNTEKAQVAQQVLNERCGLCHGEQPQYGAPYSLTDLESLTADSEGLGRLERAVERLLEGTMPPVGQPSLSVDEAQAFIEWATCGEGGQYVAPPGGFQVDRPVYQSLSSIPTEALIKDFVAPQTSVPADRADDYQCFGFHGPEAQEGVSSPRSILRLEPVIDDARVVHHIVLYETDREVVEGESVSCGAGLSTAIYAWAPGQDPLHFREGGLVSNSSKRYILEIHYNNSAGFTDIVDSSGVRIYHSAPVEPAIDMMTFGPDGFILPGRQRTEVRGDCVISEELDVIAMMPHMHEIGVDFDAKILREGSEDWEGLISLSGWDFNAQLVYDGQGTHLNPGDRVRTRCLFNNEGSQARVYGAFTEDEMCYHFVYVSPPPTERRCNVAVQDRDGTYPVGSCAPTWLNSHETLVNGSYFEGTPPPLHGGELPAGEFILTNLEMWFPSYDLGIAVLDPDLSFFEAAGALSIDEAGAFALDLQGEVNLVSARGAQFMRALNLSFSGNFDQLNAGEPELNAFVSCPDELEVSFTFEQTPDDPTLTLYLPFSAPIDGVQVMRFTLRSSK